MSLLRTSRLFVLVVLLTLPILLFFSSCASETTTSSAPVAEKVPYKIGAVFAISGFNSPLGTSQRDTAKILVDQINAKGGIAGHNLELVVYDTESDEVKAVNAVKRLVEEDKVLAVIGPSSNSESLALIDTIERAKTPLLSCAASVRIIQPTHPWIFKTPQSDSLAVTELYNYIKKEGTTDIAILTSTNDVGAIGKEALEGAAKDAGINIVASEVFGDKNQDITAQVTRIKDSSAKALIVWATNPGAAAIAKSAKAVGLKIPLYMGQGIANQKFIELAGDAANGIIFPGVKLLIADRLADSDPQKAVLSSYAKGFQERYGRAPDTYGGYAYDALTLLTKVLEKVGPDKDKIREELENTKGFVGTAGVFNMTPQDHNGLGEGSLVMIKIVGGKWTPAG